MVWERGLFVLVSARFSANGRMVAADFCLPNGAPENLMINLRNRLGDGDEALPSSVGISSSALSANTEPSGRELGS